MVTKVGINGFGRIGRQVLKAITDRHGDTLEVVAINDLVPIETNANLLKYDSNYGQWKRDIRVEADGIAVDGKLVKVFSERDPGAIPWGSVGAEIVIESTGLFTDATKAVAHRRTPVEVDRRRLRPGPDAHPGSPPGAGGEVVERRVATPPRQVRRDRQNERSRVVFDHDLRAGHGDNVPTGSRYYERSPRILVRLQPRRRGLVAVAGGAGRADRTARWGHLRRFRDRRRGLCGPLDRLGPAAPEPGRPSGGRRGERMRRGAQRP